MFPLLTSSEGKDRVKVIFDYRADCPIVEEGYEINRRFEKAVRRVGKYLLLNNETKEYYKELSQLQEDYLKLMEKFL